MTEFGLHYIIERRFDSRQWQEYRGFDSYYDAMSEFVELVSRPFPDISDRDAIANAEIDSFGLRFVFRDNPKASPLTIYELVLTKNSDGVVAAVNHEHRNG